MIGRTLSHYRVDDPLGAGGMGVVFRARDLHLERDVALKILPEGALADDESRRRFRREALALSRLNHPNIGAVYDFDTEQGLDFLVMELVPGETLEGKLARGPLPETEVTEIGIQIAAALETAHESGVVHRDLKPGNVVLTPRGQIKVLDFGLAKLQASVGQPVSSAALTAPQTVVGTLHYMAPEQLLGTEVDERTDLFALGALLYQASTGQPPFTATLSTALINEILNHTPAAPRARGAAISSALEQVILRCLEKDPQRRHRSAHELRIELEHARASSATTRGRAVSAAEPGRIESLAVLPLEDLSPGPREEYFADGMTEALISDLARIGALRVASRTSAMHYKGVRKPLPQIARELGVDAIVEGSVLRAGGRVRITAQLIDAATDRHIWAERYERELHDVLALQSEVAQAIARGIQVKLTRQEASRLAHARVVDPIAHEAYLRGRFHWNLRTEENLHRAIDYFNRAIEKDAVYAPPYAGLADCYNVLADRNRFPPQLAFPRAKAAAAKALELDPDLAEAYCSLGYSLCFYDWDWKESEAAYRRCLDLDHRYPTGHQWYAMLLTALGRTDEAIAEALRAEELDPFSPVMCSSAGDTFYYAERFDDAIAHYLRGIDLGPDEFQSHFDLGRAYEQSGRYDQAIAEFSRATEMAGRDPKASPALGAAYAFAGRTDEARAILQALERLSRTEYVAPYAIASIHAGLGEHDRVLEWLEKALVARDRALVWVRTNPRLRALRSDPRFTDLVRRVGLPA
ncbi:MAG TPA: protein kinase [Candidatus Limnocylindria bacterium]|nr:protein kinase [Candidatus Limnocylindria bacterium]